MDTPTKAAKATGLRGRLLAYFDENPDEELKISDIVAKFDAHPRNVESTLTRMRQLGELEPAHVWRRRA
jgi:hypothetical protein